MVVWQVDLEKFKILDLLLMVNVVHLVHSIIVEFAMVTIVSVQVVQIILPVTIMLFLQRTMVVVPMQKQYTIVMGQQLKVILIVSAAIGNMNQDPD